MKVPVSHTKRNKRKPNKNNCFPVPDTCQNFPKISAQHAAVRHSGKILGVPQTMRWFEQMQERITGFVASHSGISEKRYTELMMRTGELVMDVGTLLDGRKAVREKLIDELGGRSDALAWLYREIEGK